jgi:hypothetical protein
MAQFARQMKIASAATVVARSALIAMTPMLARMIVVRWRMASRQVPESASIPLSLQVKMRLFRRLAY